MKVALYARVSTQDQNPENQKNILMDWVKRNGHDYEYIEEIESTRKERPLKYALLTRLRNKEFDAVVVWKLDRWARDTKELLTEIDELSSKKIGFISLTENIDLNTASGKLMLGMLSVLAQFERDRFKERQRIGLDRKIQELESKGLKYGRPKGSKDKKIRRKSGYYLRWLK